MARLEAKWNSEWNQRTGKKIRSYSNQVNRRVANYYDVYYRVHVQTYGWLGWVKNGDKAGTEGMAKRTEAIQIQIKRRYY